MLKFRHLGRACLGLVSLFALCGLTANADTFTPVDGTKYLLQCKGNSKFATYNSNAVLSESDETIILSAQESAEKNSFFYIASSGEYFTIRSAQDKTQYVYAISTADANSNVGVKAITDEQLLGDECLWTISEYSDGYNIIPKNGSYSWNVRGSYNSISHIGMWSENSTDDDTWYICSVSDYIENVKNEFQATLNGYYTIASASSERAVSIYNDFMLDANKSYDLTLQNTSIVGTANNYIWYVETNLDEENLSPTLSIKNGQGTPIKVSGQNQSYNGTLYAYSTLNYGLYNSSDNSYYFTQGINASDGNYALSDGTRHLTTWAGMSSAADDRWIFTNVTETSNYCNVSVVDNNGAAFADGYASYNSEYAKNGGFFTNTPSSADEVTAGEVNGYTSEKTVDSENHTVTVTYTQKYATVTYNYYIGSVADASLYTTSSDVVYVGSTVTNPTAPAFTTINSYTIMQGENKLTSEDAVSSTDAITVNVICAEDLPFKVSDDENTYYLAFHMKYSNIITYDGESLSYADDGTVNNPEDKYLWYVKGDLLNGFLIYSKNSETNFLTKESGQKACTFGTDETKGRFKLYESDGYVKDSYCFKIDNDTHYINLQTDNGVLNGWGDNDAGSSIIFYPESHFPLTYYKNNYADGCNGPDGALGTYPDHSAATYAAAIESNPFDTDAIANLITANTSLANASIVEVPTSFDGLYYRLMNKKKQQYMTFASGDTYYLTTSTDNKSVGSVIAFTKSTDDSYTISVEGLALGSVSSYSQNFVPDAETTGTFTITHNGNGLFVVKNSNNTIEYYTEYSYLHLHLANSGDNGNVVSWESSADESQWYFVPATDVEIALNKVGEKSYATTCLPFGISNVKNATPYTGAYNTDKTKIEATEIDGGTIPAETGVILVSDEAKKAATLTIGTATAFGESTTNDLSGTCVPITNNNYLTFGRIQGQEESATEPGFYLYTGTTIPANKAYLSSSSTSESAVRLTFGGEPSSINVATLLDGEQSNAPIYDLSGRRVVNPVKGGIYLQGGKKFIK